MKKGVYLVPGLVLVLIAFNYTKIKLAYRYYINPCYYETPVKQQDFPQTFLEVDLNEYYAEINAVAAIHFKIDTLETIAYKNNDYPILAINQKVLKREATKKKLLVIAGVHGNESGGTFAVIELLKEFNANPSKFENWELRILAPVNPIGTLEMSRYNECGCDLNRNFTLSKQKGVVVQKKDIDSFNPAVIVSMHESPAEGFLIHSNNYLKDELLGKMLADIEGQGIVLSREDYFGRKLAMKGNSKIDGTLKFLNRLVKVQALGDYVSKKGIIEITTESGWNTDDKFQRVNSHVFAILSLINNYK